MGRIFITLLIAAVILWGVTSACTRLYTDPFGMTTRQEIRSYTEIETTRLEVQAEIEVANAQANAQIESARLLADATKVQAQEQRKSTQAWANVLPILLIIITAGGALWLFIMYRGRILLVLANQGLSFIPQREYFSNTQAAKARATTYPLDEWQVCDNPEAILAQYAANHNQSIRFENGYYLLIDKQTHQVVRQLASKNW